MYHILSKRVKYEYLSILNSGYRYRWFFAKRIGIFCKVQKFWRWFPSIWCIVNTSTNCSANMGFCFFLMRFFYIYLMRLCSLSRGAPVNGRTHPLPFAERMMTIQQVARIALKYSDEVELFLSDDNPYLPEFYCCDTPCQHVANALCLQYCECHAPYDISSVHMRIRN